MKKINSIFKLSTLSIALLTLFSFSPIGFAQDDQSPTPNQAPTSNVENESDNVDIPNLMGKSGSAEVHNHITLFFLQKADSLQVKPATDRKEPNCYQIVLTGVADSIIYFADAPRRVAGTIPMSKFLTSWQHGYPDSQSGPNAVIHGDVDHKDIGDIVLLSNPAYDNKLQQMTYSACSIRHNNKIFSDDQIINNALLLIDPISTWPP